MHAHSPGDAPKDNLTEAEAAARAARVSGVRYTLDLDLAAGSESYSGTLRAEFAARTGGAPLFVDFTGKRLASVVLNGKTIESPAWNRHRLALPDELVAAENVLEIRYENDCSHTGSGFHRFSDPEDGREYLFSDFEPFNAHQLFPCFDQPDLKATYAVTVTAPEAWVVVSNGRELSSTPAGGGRAKRVFETTKPFSTYLMAVIAGEYAVYEDRTTRIPLRILCRRALTKHMDPDEIFTVTKQGFEFFESYFGFPYPFGKYDQAFVPEFNAGAMENVAAVTHGEHMIFRGQVSETQRLSRAETVLHELAHMWFGNLVTMRWWRDLWLNESFATYISYVAMAGATRWKTAWESFHAKIKSWAMRQDELVTTHPIAGDVPDTDATFLNFDGITYGKGASVLKQLTAYLGEDSFREGLRLYFQRHAWGNTTLQDFLAALGETSRRDLKEWSRVWLETAGLGSLTVSYTVDAEDRVVSFHVLQDPAPQNEILRPHKTHVALFYPFGSGLVVRNFPVTVQGGRTPVPRAIGDYAPSFVSVNHGDHAYAKVVLDTRSLLFVQKHLERIEEPLLRATLWGTLWQMVRDRKLAAYAWCELVAGKSQHEGDPETIETVVSSSTLALARYLTGEPERAARRLLVTRAWSRLEETRGDLQLAWLRGTIQLAQEPADLDRLVRLMDSAEKLAGVEIDQNMRWSVIAKLVALGRTGAEERLAAEKARDPSDKGQKSAFQCEASRPSAPEKERHWKLFVEGTAHSSDFLKNGMARFHWVQQKDLLAPYVERFFSEVEQVYRERNHEYARAFVLLLYPSTRAEPAVLARAQQLLARVEAPGLRRLLLEANDELARSIRCRELQR